MTMLNHLSAFADRALRAAIPAPARYAVSLIDRRTGKPHRISDIPTKRAAVSRGSLALQLVD